MKRILFILLLFLQSDLLTAQSYSLQDLERQFMANNSQLIAEKLNIGKAEAEIAQAKVWLNPNLSISEINLWHNEGAEEQPYIFGKFGRYQQFDIELEQIIETAGKRKKRVALKTIERNGTALDYEELLRELLKEIRLGYYTLNRLQSDTKQLGEIIALYTQMSDQYQKQVDKQNLRKVDYYRIQAELIGVNKDYTSMETEILENMSQLRLLCGLPELKVEQILFYDEQKELSKLIPQDILSLAKSQNIGLKSQNNIIAKSLKQLEIERAESKPNVTLKVELDRGGSIMKNFVSFGAAMDLPIFNKNKGNIKVASYELEQQRIIQDNLQMQLELELKQLMGQIKSYERSIHSLPNEQLKEQEVMIENYKKHLLNKEVTLIEFIDFVKSYREAKQAYAELQEGYQKTFEELQYLVGKDLRND